MTKEVDISPEELKSKITKLVEEIIKKLNYKNIQLFQNKPTINIFYLKNETIGISLSDENQLDLKCKITHKPEKGKIYFFISKFWLKLAYEFFDYQEFAEDKVQKIIEEIHSENAYSLNMKRVRDLIRDGHNAVAIVFLISAFENATKDLFFNNNELWFFPIEETTDQDLLDEFGIKIDDDNKKFKPNFFLGDEGYYFDEEKYERFNKWNRIEHMNYIFNLCKSLRILDQYMLSLIGNDMKEIGFYEILKRTMIKSLKKFSKFNFQSIKGKGSVRWCFKNFFSLNLTPMNNELNLLQNVIDKRHEIIHGFLEDDKISKTFVENSYDAVNQIISFLKDQIYEWHQLAP